VALVFMIAPEGRMRGLRAMSRDPASLLVNRQAKPAKTDGIDVERMQRALGRYLRGEADACSVVRIPSVEDEDAKWLHRERKRLVQERVQHANRIKARWRDDAELGACGRRKARDLAMKGHTRYGMLARVNPTISHRCSLVTSAGSSPGRSAAPLGRFSWQRSSSTASLPPGSICGCC
jgi:hypothetical protein